jgi:hypothetical protein
VTDLSIVGIDSWDREGIGSVEFLLSLKLFGLVWRHCVWAEESARGLLLIQSGSRLEVAGNDDDTGGGFLSEDAR